jgi:hypothetical protein
MTFLCGFLHTLPFLIANNHQALTRAYFVVGMELLVMMSSVRHRYFASGFSGVVRSGPRQGSLVVTSGVLIGSS